MKRLLVIFVVCVFCTCVFATTTWTGQGNSWLKGQITGSAVYGVFDTSSHSVTTKATNAETWLVMYIGALNNVTFTEWDSSGDYKVTMYANFIRIYSANGKVDDEYKIDYSYSYTTDGNIKASYSDLPVSIFRGLCSNSDVTIEFISAIGEKRCYVISSNGFYDYFFDWLTKKY